MSEAVVEDPWRTVRLATVEENTGDRCFTVGLSEDAEGLARSLVFQCSLDAPGGQDIRLGLDTYCTITECATVHYGGLAEVALRGSRLRLVFDASAVSVLELDNAGPIELDLDVPQRQLAPLAAGLRRVFSYGDPGQHPRVLDL